VEASGLALAASVPAVLRADVLRLQNRLPVTDSFPLPMQRAAQDMASFAAPLLLSRAAGTLAHFARPGKPAKRVRRSISETGEPGIGSCCSSLRNTGHTSARMHGVHE
jgi:hypothetical protein